MKMDIVDTHHGSGTARSDLRSFGSVDKVGMISCWVLNKTLGKFGNFGFPIVVTLKGLKSLMGLNTEQQQMEEVDVEWMLSHEVL